MSNLVQWARKRSSPWPAITLDQAALMMGGFEYGGLGYGGGLVQTQTQNRETIPADFLGFIEGAYKSNGAIFATMLARMMLFSEARLTWRDVSTGRPGKLFGTKDLKIVETPWPNGTTGDLLARAITDADLSGNFYCTRVPLTTQKGSRLARLRPDWVTIILGSYKDADLSQFDPTAELVGYVYQPGGPGSGIDPKFYLPEEVVHWAPIPDPMAQYRGMSWVQPVLQEILGDKVMNTHKEMYFVNGASPNLVVSMETGKMDVKTFQEWVDKFEGEHSGALNAYKTLYLGQGATATVVGNSLKDLDYAIVQGHGETRIAAAGGVPAIIVGFSEGLEASTYSNFSQARRAFSDRTLRPLWRNFCASMQTLVYPVPGGAELWYDDRDIAFLKEDQKDAAEVQLTKATAMRLLVDAGYTPESVVKAVEADDYTLLEHSGLYSVQLQKPGQESSNTEPTQNGNNGSSGQLTNGAGKGGDSQKSEGSATMPLVGDPEALAKALLAARAGT